MFQIARIPVLVLLFGSLGALSVPTALAQSAAPGDAQREQFLRLLLDRQDRAIQQALARRMARIESQQARLAQSTPRTPQQARYFEQLGLRLDVLASRTEQQIANPPASPFRLHIEQRRNILNAQAQVYGAQVDRLSQITPTNPQQARQIERLMEASQRRLGAVMSQVLFLDRVLATPYAPRNVAVASTFLLRPLSWLPAGF